jgi:uncharacterized membrane protein
MDAPTLDINILAPVCLSSPHSPAILASPRVVFLSLFFASLLPALSPFFCFVGLDMAE